MNTRRLIGVFLLLLFVMASAVLFLQNTKYRTDESISHEKIAFHVATPVSNAVPEILVRKGWKRIDFSQWPSLNITQSQSNEVVIALAGVVWAFVNGQPVTMQEKIAQLPSYLTAVKQSTFDQIMSPVRRKVRDFTDGKQTVKWSNVTEFSNYMDSGIALTRFVCDLECEREFGSKYAKYAEYKLLHQMQDRLDEFKQGGQVDFEQKMQQYIDDWIEHIESMNGYTRRYAWLQISAQYEHITEGSWSVGQLFRHARMQASGLVKRCNYRPRWLDEDFPLPEGVKDTWERDARIQPINE